MLCGCPVQHSCRLGPLNNPNCGRGKGEASARRKSFRGCAVRCQPGFIDFMRKPEVVRIVRAKGLELG